MTTCLIACESTKSFKIHASHRQDRDYWTDLDQAMLPSYALPIRMKSPDQILSVGEIPDDFNSMYGKLVNYFYWNSRIAKHKQVTDEDYLDGEDVEQARSIVIKELLETLTSVAKGELKHDTWLCEQNGEKTGLIYDEIIEDSTEAWKPPANIGVNRNSVLGGQPVGGLKAHVISLNGSPRCSKQQVVEQNSAKFHPSSLLVKNSFLIQSKNDPEAGKSDPELGRVIVRLPISFGEFFFKEMIEVVELGTKPLEFADSGTDSQIKNLFDDASDTELQPAQIVEVKIGDIVKSVSPYLPAIFDSEELDDKGNLTVESNGSCLFVPSAAGPETFDIEIKYELEQEPAYFDLFSHFEVCVD